MLKENWRFVSRIERIGDFLITFFAFFAAYYGRASLIYWNEKFHWKLPFEGSSLAPLKDYFIVLAVALFCYLIILQAMGVYSSMRLSSSWHLLRMFSIASMVVFILLAAVLYMLKIDLSRSFVGLFCLLMAFLLTAERYLVLGILRHWRRRGFNYRNVVICGVGEQAVRLTGEISKRPELGVKIRCFADLRNEEEHNSETLHQFRLDLRQAGCKIIGRIALGRNSLEKALKRYAIDEVIFVDVSEVMSQVEEMVLICAEQGVRTTIAADLFSLGMVRSGISYFGGMPLIHFQTGPRDNWRIALKRLIDITAAAMLLLALSPLFALIALAVYFSSGAPIFFVQKRVGLNGHLFDLFKFRSMYNDAESKLEQLQKRNEMDGPAFKLTNDPRVTPVGHILRRFSLDELPQLWNVFRGDMSLVGPRPPVPGEVNTYQRHYRRRLSMRPGLTCTWQVSGRNQIKDFDSWVKLDLEYIDNWSLRQDFVLLFRTIPAVLLGTGAK